MSHGHFFRQGEGGPMTIEGVIFVMLVVDVVSTTGQVKKVEVWILGESPTKSP